MRLVLHEIVVFFVDLFFFLLRNDVFSLIELFTDVSGVHVCEVVIEKLLDLFFKLLVVRPGVLAVLSLNTGGKLVYADYVGRFFEVTDVGKHAIFKPAVGKILLL